MTDSSAEQLVDRAIHRRAVEAAAWDMAAVNYELMRSVMAPKGEIEFLYVVLETERGT